MKNDYLKLGRLALVLVCLMCAVTPVAAMQFTAGNIKATPGKEVSLPIEVVAEDDIMGFQFDVMIPNGFEVTGYEFTSMISKQSIANASMLMGAYRVLACETSPERPCIKAGSGKIMTLHLKVPEQASGTFACSINNTIIVRSRDQKNIEPEPSHFVITCPEQQPAGPLSIGDTFMVAGIYYRVTGPKTVEVTYRDEDYNSYSGAVSVPPEVNYGDVKYTVEAIGSKAFYECSSLKKVKLPNTIKVFKTEAFLACYELAEINLPEGLTRLDTYSFAGYPKLTTLVIPSTLTSVGYAVFSSLPNLRHIEVAKGNPVFDSRGDCNALIKTETDELLKGCVNTVIPDNVKIIGENAFQGCPITSIDIPSSVREIEMQAFVATALKSVFIPEQVKEVGSFAFCNCKDLESATIAGSAQLNFGAFMGASALKKVTVLAPLAKIINVKCFDEETYNNATLYTVYEDMSSYDTYEAWKKFKNIRLKCYDYYVDGIYYMRNGANYLWVTFKDENYNSYRGTQLRIPSNVYIDGKDFMVTEIRHNAFYNCSNLKYVTLPDKNLCNIQTSAFKNCTSLQEIRIADRNHDFYIEGGAFSGCTNLKRVYLSSNCSFPFEYNIFSRCDNITWVVSKSMTPPKMNTSIFTKATYAKTPLYVHKNAVTAYKQDPSWGDFKKIVGLTDEELQQRYDSMTEVKDNNQSGNVEHGDEGTCEYEEKYDGGEPLTQAQMTNDHLFVRQEDEADDVVTLKGDKSTFVEVWLDDDEIYTNKKLQDLVSVARTGEGDFYNEVTYSAVSFELYLPMNVELDLEQLIKGDRMPLDMYLNVGPVVGTKEIKGKTYKIHKVSVIKPSIEGGHFSAQTISDYRKNGALRKNDGYLLGLWLTNTDSNVAKPGNDDFIIANVEFVINETYLMGWPKKDSRYFYANGFANHQGKQGGICCLYHRVKLNYK